MNKELKARWVEALRSGKYKQGKAMLRSIDNKFCCLGVLCDIVDSDKWEPGEGVGDSHYDFIFKGESRSGYLPSQLRIYADITEAAQRKLSTMNDMDNSNFSFISDFIEANL